MTPKFRNTMVQLLFAGCLMLVIGGFVIIAQHNMAAQGITSGFSFLGRATGWDLGFSFLAYSIRDPYWWALWIGFLNTLFVGYFSILMATVLGLFVAMMRISGNPVLNTVSLAYVEIIRNVPPILQVLAWYALFAALPAPRQAIDAGGGVFLTARGIYVPMLNVHGGAIFAASIFVVLAIGALLWVG